MNYFVNDTYYWWSKLARGIEAALGRRARRLESRDLLAWGREFLPQHFVAPPSAMHQWLATELDTLHTRRGTKLNVIGPRGGAKSTIATLAYCLRVACEAWEPYVWIVSDTRQQAWMHLENIKAELSGNPRLADAYPRACRPGRRWQSSAIELANGVAIEAYGTGQRIRGRRREEHRPTLIVCDDIQNDSHMQSGLQRASSREWFHGTLLKAGTPQTNVVNLATALHRDALAMQLQTTPGWHSRLFRAIERWPDREDLWQQWQQLYEQATDQAGIDKAREFYKQHQAEMNRGAELLWPEVEDLITLMAMRCESGRTAFEREKQGAPIDPDGCEWPEEYFGEAIWFDTWPDEVRLRTMALDPSKGGDARRGDYSAYAMLAIGGDGNLYVEANLARRATPQMVADGVALCERFRPAVFGVEANQWQELLEGEFLAEFRRQGRWDIQPAAITNTVSKQVRIRRLGPYLARGRLRFKRDSPSTRMLVDQLRDFPGGTHDDGPDALEMALRLAEELWR